MFAIRGNNTNIGWQTNGPVVKLTDGGGQEGSYTPNRQLVSTNGLDWATISFALESPSGTYSYTGSNTLDFSNIVLLEIMVDTWNYAMQVDVDGLMANSTISR